MNTKKFVQVTLIALCLALTGAFVALAASPAPAAAAPAATAAPAAVPQADSTPAIDGATCTSVAPLVAPLFQPSPALGGCPDPGCNTGFDCRNDIVHCPSGTFRTCIGSTGNCDGYCTCT